MAFRLESRRTKSAQSGCFLDTFHTCNTWCMVFELQVLHLQPSEVSAKIPLQPCSQLQLSCIVGGKFQRPVVGRVGPLRGDDFDGHRIVGFEVEPHSIVQAGGENMRKSRSERPGCGEKWMRSH